MSDHYAGIDVSKAWLDLQILEGSCQRFENSFQGCKELIQFLKPFSVTRVVLEATGGYERLLAAELHAAELPVAVVNPRQVRDFAKALGLLAKTDKIDAGVLAKFAQAIKPPERKILGEHEQILKDTLTRRAQLVEMRTMEKNRFQQAHAHRVVMDIKRSMEFLEKRIEAIDKELDDLIRQSPAWQEKVNLLESVPGVGPQTARVLVAELSELGAATRHEIAALVGVAPMSRDSGAWRGKRMIVGGRASVRSALYMAAMAAKRWNPHIKAHYEKLRLVGKRFKVAIVACMRKLLVILNAMLREKQPWNIPQST